MKKQPVRMCSGCGMMVQKNTLIRLVKNKENHIFLDFTNKAAGRGAYLCMDLSCLQKAKKNRRIERSFKAKISDEIYANIESELMNHETN